MPARSPRTPLSGRLRRTAVAAALSLLGPGCGRPAPAPEPPVASAPAAVPEPCRLAVLVVFDQLRGDYLERWRPLWGEGGFRRLQADGAWFTNCHYPFACTETGPGHATLATGRSPESHGIVGNYWYDRRAAADVYCVAGTRPYQGVPPGAAGDGPSTPERLLGPTIGDALRDATGGRGRVVALGLKDRSAVFLAGRRPDACYWFDHWTGGFMTSTYYRDGPHPWVAEFNRGRPADRWFGHDWTRLRPDLDYAAHSGPDDGPGEATGWMQGRTFPHPTTGGLNRLAGGRYDNRDYYGALATSPFANELLLELAKRAIDAERLGADDVPDLLGLGLSATDPIGHSWGPDSQEVFDAVLRADRLLADLLAHLDARVGAGRYLVVLTSDHGVCPLPEVARARGRDAGRVPAKRLADTANEALRRAYPSAGGEDRWIEAAAENWLYLNHTLLARRGLRAAEVEAAVARGLKDRPGVLAAYTRTLLAGEGPSDDPIGRAVRRSFHPDRSGDVVVVPKPHHVFADDAVGTTHGSPHAYDTHVPLLVLGPGVGAGPRGDAVTPRAVAGILAAALGVAPPAGGEGQPCDLSRPSP